jgi:predicted transcriptional regulator
MIIRKKDRTGSKMTDKEAKRIGRPMKKAARGEKRASLGLKVRIEVKKRIDEAAKASGRTQSQEAEALIEQALAPYFMLEKMHATLNDIERGNIEAVFRKLGYIPLRTPHGTGWLPPGHPGLRSGFIDPAKEEG